MKVNALILVTLTASLFGGCQSVEKPAAMKEAAVLNSQADMAVLMTTLKDVMKDRSVSLGVGDPLSASNFTVLPKKPSPFETMSAAMPTAFEIMTDGKTCYIKNSATEGAVYPLTGANCSKL